jgi:uncharacterized membrane protein (UPF0127 family)
MTATATISNTTQPQAAPLQARWCASFLCQLRGLTFRRSLGIDEGLLLVQKRDTTIDAAIHMLFVFMPLGVVWINSACEVVDVKLAKPWRPMYAPQRPAKYVLEIHPQRLADFRKGDCVKISGV